MRLSRTAWLATLAALPCALLSTGVHAACTFGAPNGELTLQQVFDGPISPTQPGLFGPGQLSAANDCMADGSDARWTTDPGSFGGATIVLELAGNRGSNRFGIYDLDDPTQRLEVFQGGDAAGDSALIQISGTAGHYTVSVEEDGDVRSIELDDAAFGFYLMGANGTLYSNSADNAGGADYMYAYQGTGDHFTGGPFSVRGSIFAPSDYLLAWEDLPQGDRDYQDFLVLMRNTTPSPVPVPAAAWLLISALAGGSLVARRRTMAT